MPEDLMQQFNSYDEKSKIKTKKSSISLGVPT